jgi:hypothetical protein
MLLMMVTICFHFLLFKFTNSDGWYRFHKVIGAQSLGEKKRSLDDVSNNQATCKKTTTQILQKDTEDVIKTIVTPRENYEKANKNKWGKPTKQAESRNFQIETWKER